jgi:hypothetical protein
MQPGWSPITPGGPSVLPAMLAASFGNFDDDDDEDEDEDIELPAETENFLTNTNNLATPHWGAAFLLLAANVR